MESSGGERWAERLRALQLPHTHAYGDWAAWYTQALLLGGKEGRKEGEEKQQLVQYQHVQYDKGLTHTVFRRLAAVFLS